jgi:hypothetical protein
MQTADLINVCTHLAPWIVAILAILVWGIRGPHRSNDRDEASRQTALLERIAAQLDKLHL